MKEWGTAVDLSQRMKPVDVESGKASRIIEDNKD